jgi:hypothetical protein
MKAYFFIYIREIRFWQKFWMTVLTVFQRIHNVHKRNEYIQEISDTFKILLNQHKTISLQHQILRNSYKTYL